MYRTTTSRFFKKSFLFKVRTNHFKFSSAEINVIENQKIRALQYLEVSRENFDGIKHVSADEVQNMLRQGFVPPIFHTLCRDKDHRLFLPNTLVSREEGEVNVIELSAESVEAGDAKSAVIGEIPSFKDKSYLSYRRHSVLNSKRFVPIFCMEV